MIWAGVLVACASCYALKLAGLSLPARLLQNARVQRTVPLVPIALLAALVATQTFSTGQHLVLDVRAAALCGSDRGGFAARPVPGRGRQRSRDRGATAPALSRDLVSGKSRLPSSLRH